MEADKLVQALSVAWGGVHLYPDPKSVPAFVQAVEAIGEFAGEEVVLTVTVDGFVHNSEPVPSMHSAGVRLVEALFAAEVASLVVASAPSADEVIGFFAQLEASEEDHDLEFDLPARLQLAGVDAFYVRCHDLLEERGEADVLEVEDAVERDPEIQALFGAGTVDRLAAGFMEAGSPDVAATEFINAYRATYDKVAAGDPAGLERVVQTFVDSFFRLEASYKAAVFQEVMEARNETVFQNFLDQFSTDELAKLAGEVDDAALPLLAEYARVMSQMQGRDPGLVERVMGDSDQVRGHVAGSVSSHLAHFLDSDEAHAGAVAALSSEVAALDDQERMGWLILGDLLEIEGRGDRTKRLLRIWVAKLSAAIQEGHFEEARSWLAVVEGAELDPAALAQAFDQVASNDTMARLTGDGPEREIRSELLAELSRRSASRVLEQLAIEEDPGRRRMLIDIVSEIARVDVRSVLAGLEDPRWYVVRNLVIALGKSGRKAAGEPLARLLRHDDHRVRIEALRSLIPCLGNAAADHLIRALADEHVRVRTAAADLLDVIDESASRPALTAALRNEATSLEIRVAVIEILGRIPDPEARRVLEQVATTPGRFSQTARTLRSAAKDALRSDHG